MRLMIVCGLSVFFFFKQKAAYEMRISDWSSDVCSSDLVKNTSRRVCLRLPANSASEKLSWLMEHGSLSDGTGLGITLHQLTNKENLIRVSLAVPERKSVVQGKSVESRVDLR